MNRREFFSVSAGMAALGFSATNPFTNLVMAATTKADIKAITFDGFPIFDPRPIFGLAKTLFPEQGDALAKLWFSKIFGYTWLRTVGAHYKSFDAVIDDALTFSAKSLGLDLSTEKQKQLIDIWWNLELWPDVKPALQQLKEQNSRQKNHAHRASAQRCVWPYGAACGAQACHPQYTRQ